MGKKIVIEITELPTKKSKLDVEYVVELFSTVLSHMYDASLDYSMVEKIYKKNIYIEKLSGCTVVNARFEIGLPGIVNWHEEATKEFIIYATLFLLKLIGYDFEKSIREYRKFVNEYPMYENGYGYVTATVLDETVLSIAGKSC